MNCNQYKTCPGAVPMRKSERLVERTGTRYFPALCPCPSFEEDKEVIPQVSAMVHFYVPTRKVKKDVL